MINRVEEVDDLVGVSHALISVADKSGLDGLVTGLLEANPEVVIFSTGGTFQVIEKALGERADKHLRSVSSYTGQPEMQGGLVKTLDFKIYLGLLSETGNEAHEQDLRRMEAIALDLVVSNLYPFEQTIQASGVTIEDARANIDIGGPTMIRAAAKNFLRVGAVCDPADYPRLLAELREHRGSTSFAFRLELAKKAFAHTAKYDVAISSYLGARRAPELSSTYSIRKERA